MQLSADNLIWIDLEMTGLYPEHDLIIEIATVVTDAHLEFSVEGPVIAIHQSDATLAAMARVSPSACVPVAIAPRRRRRRR